MRGWQEEPAHVEHAHWCPGPDRVMNMAGQVVLEICQCGVLQSVPERALSSGRHLASDLDRLAKQVIRDAARDRMRTEAQAAELRAREHAPVTAYWTEGDGREPLRAAPGWCAPAREARSDDLWPAKPLDPEPKLHHWGEYDEWLKPADREFLVAEWRRAGGPEPGAVDTSWVTTVPEYHPPAFAGWALMVACGLLLGAVGWGIAAIVW